MCCSACRNEVCEIHPRFQQHQLSSQTSWSPGTSRAQPNPRPHGLKTFKAVEMSLEIQKLSKWLKSLIRQYTTLTSKTPPAKGGFSQASNPFEQTSYTSATDKASNPFDKPQTNKVIASNPFDLSGGSKGGFGQSSNPPLYKSVKRGKGRRSRQRPANRISFWGTSPKREQEYLPLNLQKYLLPRPQTSHLLSPLWLPVYGLSLHRPPS